jgi:hypothetical protein
VYEFSREAEAEVVRALDLATGKELWKQSYPVAYEMNPAATGHGKGPKSTPVVADGRLFTLGITGVLVRLGCRERPPAVAQDLRDGPSRDGARLRHGGVAGGRRQAA